MGAAGVAAWKARRKRHEDLVAIAPEPAAA